MTTQRPPDFVAAREHVLEQVVRFARTLRDAGVAVPANGALAAARALVEVGLADRDRVEAAMRASLLSDPRDAAAFDEHFPSFWYRLRSGLEATATADDLDERVGTRLEISSSNDVTVESQPANEAVDGGAEGTPTEDAEPISRRVSEHEPAEVGDADGDRERTATYSAGGEGTAVDEDAPTAAVVDGASVRRLERALATCAGRRWNAAEFDRGIDARRALRESVATGGVPLSLPTRGRERAALRCTVLVDVSQSVLDTIDRGFLLSFLAELVAAGRAIRVFFFDTEIREVTDAFERATGDPVAALARAEVAWGGGTRIGASIETLRERWPAAVDRRTPVLVISDGLDVGEIERLADGMTWLARRAGAVFWLNPLAASPAYEPTCRGMAAARPYVDGLFAFAGAADLAEIARQIERHGEHGPIGYEHDFRKRKAEGSS